jgi:hypothetical protein
VVECSPNTSIHKKRKTLATSAKPDKGENSPNATSQMSSSNVKKQPDDKSITRVDFGAIQHSLDILDVKTSNTSSIESLVNYLSECQKKILRVLHTDPVSEDYSRWSKEQAKKLLVSIVDRKYQLITHLTNRMNHYENTLENKTRQLQEIKQEIPIHTSSHISTKKSEEKKKEIIAESNEPNASTSKSDLSITRSEEPDMSSFCRKRRKRFNRHGRVRSGELSKTLSKSVPVLSICSESEDYWNDIPSPLYNSTDDVTHSNELYNSTLHIPCAVDEVPQDDDSNALFVKLFNPSSAEGLRNSSCVTQPINETNNSNEITTPKETLSEEESNEEVPSSDKEDTLHNDTVISSPSFTEDSLTKIQRTHQDIGEKTQAALQNEDVGKQRESPQVMTLVQSLTKCQKDIIRMLIINQIIPNNTTTPTTTTTATSPPHRRKRDL